MGRPFWIVATVCSTLLLQKFDKTGFQTQQLKAPTIVRKKVRDLQEELRNLSDGLAQKAQSLLGRKSGMLERVLLRHFERLIEFG